MTRLNLMTNGSNDSNDANDSDDSNDSNDLSESNASNAANDEVCLLTRLISYQIHALVL